MNHLGTRRLWVRVLSATGKIIVVAWCLSCLVLTWVAVYFYDPLSAADYRKQRDECREENRRLLAARSYPLDRIFDFCQRCLHEAETAGLSWPKCSDWCDLDDDGAVTTADLLALRAERERLRRPWIKGVAAESSDVVRRVEAMMDRWERGAAAELANVPYYRPDVMQEGQ